MEYYNKKVTANGTPVRKLLYDVAQRRCLVGAALHLETSNKRGCRNVLQMLIQNIESLMIEKERAERLYQHPYNVTLSDLRMLRSTNKEQK